MLPLLPALAGLVGCSADHPMNPSFPLTVSDAQGALREMRAEPKPLERPLVVVGGLFDIGIVAPDFARAIAGVTSDPVPLTVTFAATCTFERCRERLVAKLEDRLPSDDPDETVEVDVVAISMGGLVARYAASVGGDGVKRLRIRRLYTISSPHLGASMAGVPTLDRRIIDMRAGSDFLAALNGDAEVDIGEIVPYVRLGDAMVGPANAAPPGRNPWWVANEPFSLAHVLASRDPRIVADIARRLRGETSFTTTPAAPLPETRETR